MQKSEAILGHTNFTIYDSTKLSKENMFQRTVSLNCDRMNVFKMFGYNEKGKDKKVFDEPTEVFLQIFIRMHSYLI